MELKAWIKAAGEPWQVQCKWFSQQQQIINRSAELNLFNMVEVVHIIMVSTHNSNAKFIYLAMGGIFYCRGDIYAKPKNTTINKTPNNLHAESKKNMTISRPSKSL